MKKVISVLLILSLLLALGACAGKEQAPYRILEELDSKQYGSVCRSGDKLAVFIDAAMSVLAADGTLSSISAKWLGSDRICLKGSADALTELHETIQQRSLIVGVEADLRPIAFLGENGYEGMSVDIANAIGQLLGWEIRIQPVQNGDIATQLSSGNIDCALGFGINGLSPDKFEVGGCYMESRLVIAVAADSEIKSLKDLDGQRIGTTHDAAVQTALAASEKAVKYSSGATVYLSATRCMNALEKGWCAAVAMDSTALNEYFKK